MSFAGIDFSLYRQSPEVLYGSYYDGIVERIISQYTKENAHTFTTKIHGSQGFDWKRLKIGSSLSYSHYDNPLLVQHSVLRYSGDAVSTSVDISLTPFKWLSFSYIGDYYWARTRQKGGKRQPWWCSINNSASLNFMLPGDITFSTSFNHYYNKMNSGDKSFLLLNAEAKYAIKRFSFILSCDNIFNRKTYSYSNLSALTATKSVYDIRPLCVLLKVRFRLI